MSYSQLCKNIVEHATTLKKAVPRLVAVSKTQPIDAILSVYGSGHLHFGENYVQELVSKSEELPKDIRWHFIGQLQSNKAKQLVKSVPGLWCVESVNSVRLANLLDRACGECREDGTRVGGKGPAGLLRVLVQVNTSEEEQKGGVEAGKAAELARHIIESCPNLLLAGVMTVGKLGDVSTKYFDKLNQELSLLQESLSDILPQVYENLRKASEHEAEAYRELVAEHGESDVPSDVGIPDVLVPGNRHYKYPSNDTDRLYRLETSMGMSGDFRLAIECDTANVRIGSSVFGERSYPAGKGPAAALEKMKAAEAGKSG